jgi:hypothetical protein
MTNSPTRDYFTRLFIFRQESDSIIFMTAGRFAKSLSYYPRAKREPAWRAKYGNIARNLSTGNKAAGLLRNFSGNESTNKKTPAGCRGILLSNQMYLLTFLKHWEAILGLANDTTFGNGIQRTIFNLLGEVVDGLCIAAL